MDGAQVKNSYESIAESMIIMDHGGTIQWASPSVHNLLGYLPHEIVGKEIFELVHRAFSKRLKKIYYQLQRGSNVVNEALMQLLKKNGEPIALFLTFNSLPCFPELNAMVVYLRQFDRERKLEGVGLLNDEAEIEIELRAKIEQEIAAELHDHINPTLTAVKLIVEHSIQRGNYGELKKVPEILGNLIGIIRNVSHTITKRGTRDFELHEALKSVREGFKISSNLRIVLKYDKSIESLLRTNQKVHLVRIIQEQLTNIIKHASANKVLISFQYRNERIIVVTRDNGRGFDPENYREGIGISNMYFRVNLLNGNMHINSKYHEGTTTTIVLPVD
jgi:PAS domain S-box-containing protein